MKIIIKYLSIGLVGLILLYQNGFSQSFDYKDLSGIWHIKQNDIWYKHISVDFVSKNHEYSWNQLINEKDSISRSIFGSFKISKKDKEYIVTLNGKMSFSESNVPAKTIRFFIRKNSSDNYSIQFLSEKPTKDEIWDSSDEGKTYSMIMFMRTNE
jgi:hypothetical protein